MCFPESGTEPKQEVQASVRLSVNSAMRRSQSTLQKLVLTNELLCTDSTEKGNQSEKRYLNGVSKNMMAEGALQDQVDRNTSPYFTLPVVTLTR